jgi:uncharacterized protein with von Willebrand factor type A (vWA) domain
MVTEDVALLAARFGAALRGAGVPADPARCARFAAAVTVARPATLYQLYLCALATLVTGQAQVEPLRRVFEAFFGGTGEEPAPGRDDQPRPARATPDDLLAEAARAAQQHGQPDGDGQPGSAPGDTATASQSMQRIPVGDGEAAPEDGDGAAVPALASRAERLAGTDFAELTGDELAALAGLMRKLTLAVPQRRSRRQRRTSRGRHTDLRNTLRQARRTGGHPLRLARRSPAMRPRQLIVLCDISGSMEPYARAMLQLLYCAAGGAEAEVFTFATRLTRLTPALAHMTAEQALHRAGQAAPDWLGGTRIGAALQEFNDTRGRPGLARGAVVLIISDGWDTGDPAVVRREMQRLSRVAHRIIWVNPRTKSEHYQPLAGGMAAAWPFCDAVVSAHSVHALDELTAALARPARHRPSSVDATRRLPTAR